MKFIIDRNEFLKNLNNVTKIIQQKAIDPIISNVKLELDDEGLELTGSTSELAIVTKIPHYLNNRQIIRDYKNGSTLVNAMLLTEIVKRLEGDELSFELIDDTIAKIETDTSDFKLNCVRAREYRDIDFSKDGCKFVLFTQDFIEAVNQVLFAVSTRDSRPALTAVNLESDTTKLTFTATDGARLARKELNVELKERLKINIPAKTLLEVIRMITTESTIEIYANEKKILFFLNNTVIASKLVAGDYPNTKSIVPKNFFYTLEVNSDELCNAMERVSLFSSEREHVVKLVATGDKVEISSKSQQTGSAVETLNNFRFYGDRLEISFNSEYVKSAIRALKVTDVTIKFIGEMKPFTVTNKDDSSIIQLITPVRTY